jgi:alkylresorcinol/alkylpyrone synthase
VFYPHTEEMMGWRISEKGFSIMLSREVPDLVRKRNGQDVDAFLAESGLIRSDIGSWVMHTGAQRA